MKITAQSLAVIRQTLVSTRALLQTILYEGGGSEQRRRTIKARVQALDDGIKVISETLDIPPRQVQGAPQPAQEANNG